MNSLLLFPEEMLSPTSAALRGERARQAIEDHDLKPGLRISASLYNRKRGHVEVLSIARDAIELACAFSEPPLPRLDIDLIAAVPRPQTVKKVIHFAAVSGLKSVSFVRAEKTQPSYLQSKSLHPQEVHRQVTLGLEQSYDCIPPRIEIYSSLSGYIKEHAARLKASPGAKILAHGGTDSECGLQQVLGMSSIDHTVSLAIGPESGWTQAELAKFSELGFHEISLGERMFRVEQALAMIVGQVMLVSKNCGGRQLPNLEEA